MDAKKKCTPIGIIILKSVICLVLLAAVLFFEFPQRMICVLGKLPTYANEAMIVVNIDKNKDVSAYLHTDRLNVLHVDYNELHEADAFYVEYILTVCNFYGKAEAYVDGNPMEDWNGFDYLKAGRPRPGCNRRMYYFITIPFFETEQEIRFVMGEKEYRYRVLFKLDHDTDVPKQNMPERDPEYNHMAIRMEEV